MQANRKREEYSNDDPDHDSFTSPSPAKRSKKDSQTPNGVGIEHDERSHFHKILSKIGIIFESDNNLTGSKGFHLTSGGGSSQVSLRLERFLQHETHAREDFLQDMEVFIGDPVSLRRSLLPLVATGEVVGIQDSLCRCILQTNCLQKAAIDLLLSRFPELSADADEGTQDLPKLILRQVQWLDHLADGTALVEGLLDCLTCCSDPSLQRDIIQTLPEVANDADHHLVVERLQTAKTDDSSLLVPILDAFANLALPPNLLGEVIQDVLQVLDSAEQSNLPVLVRFLLQSASSDNMVNIVESIRNHLRFVNVPSEEMESSGPQKSGASYEALTLESIKQSMQYQPELATFFCKAIGEAEGFQSACLLDLWIIWVMFDLPQKSRKKALSLTKKKIKMGDFRESLLLDAILGWEAALQGTFNSMLKMANEFVCAGSPYSSFGATMYRFMFAEFKDLGKRQDVIGNIMAHAGSGIKDETDSALSILKAMVTDSSIEGGIDLVEDLKPFSPFIKNFLDYIETFLDDQVRTVFQVLCAVCREAMDDIHIIIRKSLNHTSFTFKRVGIIGGLAFVAQVSQIPRDAASQSITQMPGTSAGNSQAVTISPEALSDAISTLDLVAMVCDRAGGRCSAFLLDELTHTVLNSPLCVNVIEWLRGRYLHKLEEKFEDNDNEKEYLFMGAAIKGKLDMDLDSQEDGPDIMVPFLKILSSHKSQARENIENLCSLLRLVAALEQALHGSLAEIDALLGCPILVPHEDAIENIYTFSPPVQEVICSTLLHTINWFRELVNVFVVDKSLAARVKVVKRLENLCDLQKDFLYCCRRSPSYLLPGQSSSSGKNEELAVEDGGSSELVSQTAKKTKSKGKGKAKVKASTGSSLQALSDAIENAVRPLVPQAVQVLGFPEMQCKTYNAGGNTEMLENINIGMNTPVLLVLLKELHLNLQNSLKPPKKAFGFGGKSSAGSNEEEGNNKRIILPALELMDCYLEGNIFSTLNAQMQAISTALGNSFESEPLDDEEEETKQYISCLVLIFKCIALVCSSPYLSVSEEGQQRLRNALCQLTGGNEGDIGEHSDGSPPRVFFELYDALEDFVTCLPELDLVYELFEVLDTICQSSVKTLIVLTGSTQLSSKAYCLCNRLSTLAHQQLQRDWSSAENNPKFRYTSKTIGYIVSLHLHWAEDEPNALEVLACEVLSSLILDADGIGPLPEYPTLSSQTIAFFYGPIFQQLICIWSNTDFSKNSLAPDALIQHVHRMVLIFQCLVGYTKGNASFEKRQILSIALRESRRFIEAFLKKMPMFQNFFTTHQDQILSILKELQIATRQIQNISAHSKVLKDPSMTKEVPAIKKALESLIFSVKTMTMANNCLEAIWVGNLRHRDITGAAVQSEEEDSENSDKDDSCSEEESAKPIEVEDSDSEDLPSMNKGACAEDVTEDEDNGELDDDSEDDA